LGREGKGENKKVTMLSKIYDTLALILAKPGGVVFSNAPKITEITAAQWATAQAQVGVTNQCVLLAAANPKRKGFSVYNNSAANSCYLQTSTAANSQFAQIAKNDTPAAHFQMFGALSYTGPIYGRRNTGTGGGWCVEFE
jgi:hypothetical protein